MKDCIFCKIASGLIPAEKVYEDEQTLAFSDIDPKAPVHVLIIPKRHIESLSKVEDFEITAHIMQVIKKIAQTLGLKAGFRVVVNTGKAGGQTVDHLHFHLLGGRAMSWPPG